VQKFLPQNENVMSPNRFRRGMVVMLVLGLLAAPFMAVAAQAADVTVFAAASLQNVLDDAAKLYQTKTGDKVTISYAASSALAVAPKDSAVSLTIEKNFPLVETLGPDGKLAMASVDSAPAGKYGKAALTTLGVWDAVSPHVVQAENVRAALAFVAKGEAALGIVYGTDAKSEPAVRGRGVPENSHPKILYPVALTASAKPEARKFLEFLLSSEAAPAFEAQGFSIQGKVG
jgi:molybdate transport system substrate-binding protein